MRVDARIFLITFIVFFDSVAPAGEKCGSDKKCLYILLGPDNKPVQDHLRVLRASSSPGDAVAGSSTLSGRASGAPPTPDQIKALLDCIPDGSQFCIHLRKSGNYFVGKMAPLQTGYLPSWIRNKPQPPHSDERVYLFNPDRLNGHDAASTYNNLLDGEAKCIKEKDIRAYIKIDDNHFYTAYLRPRAQGPNDPPIWPIAGTDHQIFVRLPGRSRIVEGPLTYLAGNLVPPVIVEKMNTIP